MEFTLWRTLFWIPPIASSIMLLFSWRSGLIHRSRFLGSLYGVALVCQGLAGLFSPLWVVGLVLQAFVAIWLGLKLSMPS